MILLHLGWGVGDCGGGGIAHTVPCSLTPLPHHYLLQLLLQLGNSCFHFSHCVMQTSLCVNKVLRLCWVFVTVLAVAAGGEDAAGDPGATGAQGAAPAGGTAAQAAEAGGGAAGPAA